MSDIVKNILNQMNSYLEYNKNIEKEYNKYKELIDKIKDFIDYIKRSSLNIIKYENQDLVIELLKNYSKNKNEYLAYKYMLENTNDNIKLLPQYKNSKKYMDNYHEYLILYNKFIKDHCLELEKELEKYNLILKYRDALQSKEMYIKDTNEFLNVLNNFVITKIELNKLLLEIIQTNAKVYDKSEHAKDERIYVYKIDEIKELIKDNKEYLGRQYNELINTVSEDVELEDNVIELIDEKLINKINVSNILLAEKVYLLRKMNLFIKINNRVKLDMLVDEFKKYDKLLNKVKDIKDNDKIIRIIKGEC